MMRSFAVLLVASSVVLPARVSCESLAVDVGCEVRDFETGRRSSTSTVAITVRPPPVQLQQDAGVFRLNQELNEATNVSSVMVEVTPEARFRPRELLLRRLPRETEKIQRYVRVYVVSTDAEVTYSAIERARRMLDQAKFERALALYEQAYDDLADPNSQYGISVRYNYARALLELCLRNGYDTCELANTLCSGLEEEYEDERTLFVAEKITRRMMQDCQRLAASVEEEEGGARLALRTRELVEEWKSVEREFAAGNHAAVAGMIEALIGEYDQKADLWLALHKPKWTLQRDAGVAYVLYSDQLAHRRDEETVRKRFDALQKAIAHLKDAQEGGDESEMTQRNIELAEQKRRQAQQLLAVAKFGEGLAR